MITFARRSAGVPPALARHVFAMTLLFVLLAALPRFGRPAAAQRDLPPPLPPPPFGATWMPTLMESLPFSGVALSDPARQRLYVGFLEGFVAIDVTTGYPVDDILSFPTERLFFSRDHTALYAIPWENDGPHIAIHVIDLDSLTIRRAIPYDCPADTTFCAITDLVEGPGGRLYVVRNNQSLVDIIAAADGAPLGVIELSESSLYPYHFLEIEGHGDRLYVARVPLADDNDNGVAIYDVSNAEPALLAVHDPGFPGLNLRLAPGGDYLTLNNGYSFYQYQTDPFTLTHHHDGGSVSDISADGRILLSRPTSEGNAVTEVDALTGVARRNLTHQTPFGYLVSGAPLFAAGDEIITLVGRYFNVLRPIDHAVALPLCIDTARRQ